MAENRGPEVQGVAILFLVLSWVFVGLRCYVRGFLLRSFGIDDTLCVAALVSQSMNSFTFMSKSSFSYQENWT
jgi:hypothetical protein